MAETLTKSEGENGLGGPRTIYRAEYLEPAFFIDRIDLVFDLAPAATKVSSRMAIRRNRLNEALVLDGQDFKLLSVKLDDSLLPQGAYQVTPDQLVIQDLPDQFILEIENEIDPVGNKALEGLYMSHGMYCTQCEAEGFRKITYYPDRPDVMAEFSVKIIGDRETCPVMLSNGNRVDQGVLGDGRHWVQWDDPFPKPAYLFALVAGDLACLSDEFITRSGRKVALKIYADARDLDKCDHAMRSLKHSMKWDEDVYGLEYDLDIFNIVAVSHFNMGAMENKSLNIFNTKCVLAKAETATDGDFHSVESIVAHEYFHNWTGNRVTCRDWFQLSLKEGLTVFRDQQFSSDMGSAAVCRIADVRALRAHQFVEDAGPMAHPIRPDSYIEINNFYTSTVYEKGAEVIRMMHTLLGAGRFRQGIDLYFERHDGQAVTCADFVAAMEDASGVDLGQFRLWYEQGGTPELNVTGVYDESRKTFELIIEQKVPVTPGQKDKKPMHIPFAAGLVGANGEDMAVVLEGDDEEKFTHVLDVRAGTQTFKFSNVGQKPIPSLLRGFSAPVKLKSDMSRADLTFLMSHDSDPFARWEAGQELAVSILLELVATIRQGNKPVLDVDFAAAFRANLLDRSQDKAFLAEMLTLPGEAYLGQRMDIIAVDAVHQARSFVRRELARLFHAEMLDVYKANVSDAPYSPAAADVARRSLKNLMLSYLMENADGDVMDLAQDQFRTANNMTDEFAALAAMSESDCLAWDKALNTFYTKWQGEPLVIDKWFAVQAMSQRDDTFDRVLKLLNHPDFSIELPNRLRSLVSGFCMANQVHFHHLSGRGYRFLADMVLKVGAINPQIAARSLAPLSRWGRYDDVRQGLMKAELERIVSTPGISNDVYEIASKALID